MTVFPRLFLDRPNRTARRRTRSVEHRIPLDPKVELEVGMIRFPAYANSSTYVDLTASNRQMVLIDVTRFISPTFYFEAVLRRAIVDNISYARLYNITDAVAVAGSEVSSNDADWTRKRSGAITLSGSKQYKVQVRNTTAAVFTIIAQARIIIVDVATPLTKTEHQIELGRGSTTSGTMVEIARPGRYLFGADKFDGALTVYFEVTGYVSAKTGEFELYNLTDAASVSGSLLQTTSTSPVRLRSAAITLTSGKEYTVRLRNTVAGKETALGGARIIIVQTKAEGITKMQVIKAVGEHESTISTSYVNLSQQALLDTANFVGFQLSYCYEAVICTEAAAYPAYSALRNLTDTTMVSDSELSTASTTNVRLRSGSISLESTKEYVGAIHGSGGYYCYFSISRIIIDLTPVLPIRYFTEALIISDRYVRRVGYSRVFRVDLSVLRDVFSFIYAKAPISRKFVETLVVSVAFVRRHSGIRALRQDLSVLRDVLSFVYTPFVPPVYKFVQNLSVISVRFVRRAFYIRRIPQDLSVIKARFVRRVTYMRKQVEVVYVQVKAILKKIKKWLAWLTKRMKLSIERPQHAEFKL